jgi:D-alanyl-lipoteichoic acid acyltransferase DltB (MBOAT superfamily)
MLSTLTDYWIGLKMFQQESKKKKRSWLWLSLLINLGVLSFFKYYNFFIDSFQIVLNGFGFQPDFFHLEILLPVGISFYTFQTLSYTIDIYRGRLKPTNDFPQFALFVSFFPQLVAGPIERARDLLPQIANLNKASKLQIESGINLIVLGLFKKVMIGDTAGRYADHIFSDVGAYPSFELITALLLFTIQIYADFSGYSHIARGVAKLLGVELMKNFNQPYLSRNITEFWRRWHISLSSWLRDYVYISLGGNRRGKRRTYVNLMLTMLIGGLWHGASWNFVIWGGLHGIYLAIHKMILNNKKENYENLQFSKQNIIPFVTNVALTFFLVSFTWLFFRVNSINEIVLFFSKIIHWESTQFVWQYIKVGLSFFTVIMLFQIFEYQTGMHAFTLKIQNKAVRYGLLSAMFFVSIVYIIQSKTSPFIYFQF